MAKQGTFRRLLPAVLALILVGPWSPAVTAASKTTKKTTTIKKSTSTLPACRASREAMIVTLRTAKTYRCTKISSRSFKWRLVPAVTTLAPTSIGPVATTPQTTTPPPATAPATTPPSTEPPTTIAETSTTTPSTTTTSTSTTTTPQPPTTIPATGPGTLRITVSGANRVPAEFTLKCFKSGFGRETRYALASGETIEVRALPAPIECVISGLLANGVPIQPRATDSSAPANDLKVTVLPLPSSPALFSIQNGAREIDPTGGATPPIKTD